MNDELKTTKLCTSPTFFKGASRVIDLYGKLDEYCYQEDADYFALKNDWDNVGNAIYISIDNYEQKEEEKQYSKTAK